MRDQDVDQAKSASKHHKRQTTATDEALDATCVIIGSNRVEPDAKEWTNCPLAPVRHRLLMCLASWWTVGRGRMRIWVEFWRDQLFGWDHK